MRNKILKIFILLLAFSFIIACGDKEEKTPTPDVPTVDEPTPEEPTPDVPQIESIKIEGTDTVKVGETVAEIIEPIRQEKNKLLADKDYLDSVLASGAERAVRLAYRTLNKVYKKVGLLPRKRV